MLVPSWQSMSTKDILKINILLLCITVFEIGSVEIKIALYSKNIDMALGNIRITNLISDISIPRTQFLDLILAVNES